MKLLKFRVLLPPQAVNNTTVYGSYYSMKDCMRAIFILNSAVIAATKTAIMSLMEATDAEGSDAQAITSSSATITANTLVKEVLVDISSVANTDVLVVNGLSFTKAAALDASAREWNTGANLATCLEDPTYGVANVAVTVDGTDIYIVALDSLTSLTVTKVENSGTLAISTLTSRIILRNREHVFERRISCVAPKLVVNDATGNCLNSITLLRE